MTQAAVLMPTATYVEEHNLISEQIHLEWLGG